MIINKKVLSVVAKQTTLDVVFWAFAILLTLSIFYPSYQNYVVEGQAIIREQQSQLSGLEDISVESIPTIEDSLHNEQLQSIYRSLVLLTTFLFVWLWIVAGVFSFAKWQLLSSSINVFRFFVTHCVMGIACIVLTGILFHLSVAAQTSPFAALGQIGLFFGLLLVFLVLLITNTVFKAKYSRKKMSVLKYAIGISVAIIVSLVLLVFIPMIIYFLIFLLFMVSTNYMIILFLQDN